MSIIVWIFNWICWINQCCCCDFLHNPLNKRIAWWTSFIFLLGILACCISAFVSINRFGFAIEGTWCAIYRIYDDIIYGQLTDSKKKWHGIKHIQDKHFKRENGEYVKGKNDLFALFIILRQMLSTEDMKNLISEMDSLLENLEFNLNSITIDKVLDRMGFPYNWKEIANIEKR